LEFEFAFSQKAPVTPAGQSIFPFLADEYDWSESNPKNRSHPIIGIRLKVRLPITHTQPERWKMMQTGIARAVVSSVDCSQE